MAQVQVTIRKDGKRADYTVQIPDDMEVGNLERDEVQQALASLGPEALTAEELEEVEGIGEARAEDIVGEYATKEELREALGGEIPEESVLDSLPDDALDNVEEFAGE